MRWLNQRIIWEQIRLCFPGWGWFVVVYHSGQIAIDHRSERIEISWVGDETPIMGDGMDIRIQLLPTNEVPQESAKTRPGISDLVFTCLCWLLSRLSALTLWQGIFQTFVINFLFSPTLPTPVSSCNHQSQLKRWKHGSDFICIEPYRTCLPHSHAVQVYLGFK